MVTWARFLFKFNQLVSYVSGRKMRTNPRPQLLNEATYAGILKHLHIMERWRRKKNLWENLKSLLLRSINFLFYYSCGNQLRLAAHSQRIVTVLRDGVFFFSDAGCCLFWLRDAIFMAVYLKFSFVSQKFVKKKLKQILEWKKSAWGKSKSQRGRKKIYVREMKHKGLMSVHPLFRPLQLPQ